MSWITQQSDIAATLLRNVARLTSAELVDELMIRLEGQSPSAAFGLHIGNLNVAVRDPAYRDILSKASLLYPDGNSVRIVALARGMRLPERIVTTDLIWPVLRGVAERRGSVFFLGGPPGLAESAAAAAKAVIPDLRVAGTAPGFFDWSAAPRVADQVRQAQTDLLVVAMGVPREQVFCIHHGRATAARLLMTGGGLFGFMAGVERRAPASARAVGLEWAWRLAQDPKRLLARYSRGAITVSALTLAGLVRPRRIAD